MANELRKQRRQRFDALIQDLGEDDTLIMICDLIASGEDPKTISQNEDIPWMLIWEWLNDPQHPERMEMYKLAETASADMSVHELQGIADKSNPDNVQVDKLRIDVRKWKAQKLRNEKYGDKLQVQQQSVPVLNIVIGVPEMLPQMVVPKVIEGDVVKDDDLVI
jgi:hypothetical protein